MESIQDVIDWLTLLINSKYFETTEDTSRAVRVLKRINRERSVMSKNDEKKIRRICTKSHVLLKKIIGDLPATDEIAAHLHTLETWGFHD